MFVYILKLEIDYGSQWLCSFSLCCDNLSPKTDTGDKINYIRIPKNKKTQQGNTKKQTKKTTEIIWD